MDKKTFKEIISSGTVEEMESALDAYPELISEEYPNSILGVQTGSVSVLHLVVLSQSLDKLQLLIDRDCPIQEHDKKLLSVWVDSAYKSNSTYNEDMLAKLRALGFEFPTDKKSCCNLLKLWIPFSCYRNDDIDFIDCLIRQGFDPVASEAIAEISLLNHVIGRCRDKSSLRIVTRLLELGCNHSGRTREDTYSPLSNALVEGRLDIAELLLKYDATFNLPDTNIGGVAFHGVIRALCHSGVKTKRQLDDFVKAGLCLEGSVDGTPYIHFAVQGRNLTTLNYFIDNGVDINTKSKSGATPLITAIEEKLKLQVICILEAGADVNIMNGSGFTALDIAIKHRVSKDIRQLLEKAGARKSEDILKDDDSLDYREFAGRLATDGEPWVEVYRQQLQALDASAAESWYQLAQLCIKQTSSKPTKKWLKEAIELHKAIGPIQFNAMIYEILPLLHLDRTDEAGWYDRKECEDWEVFRYYTLSENNNCLLKGFIWLCAESANEQMSLLLRETATQMYKKVPNVGMRNAKIANACLYSLSQMPGDMGVKQIVTLKSLTKYNPALVNIKRVFDQVAKAQGVNAEELETQSVPDYGLDKIGSLGVQIGDYTALLSLELAGACSLVWCHGDKTQKTVPVAVKRDHPTELKNLKLKQKDLKAASSATKARLEALYYREHGFDAMSWMEQYLEHKLVGFHAERLIWVASQGETRHSFFVQENKAIDCHGMEINLSKKAQVSLWHPSNVTAAEVLQWRKFLLDRGITQPFKQAHREVYLVTDAERKTGNHSLRFANHILKLSQFHALSTERGWSQTRGGQWDGGSDNSATRNIPDYQLEVHLEASGAEQFGSSASGIYECVGIGKVVFYKTTPVKIDSIPSQVFSEVMRDVDLFVGVSGVVNDPDWREKDSGYWDRQAQAELSAYAKTRHEVLSGLIPKLAIANKLTLEDKHLLVQGTLMQYKIHLGSSNIMMLPSNEYLCIVPTRKSVDLKLPFEGDTMLSLILSKAFMLVNDHKIKDETIVSQIKAA